MSGTWIVCAWRSHTLFCPIRPQIHRIPDHGKECFCLIVCSSLQALVFSNFFSSWGREISLLWMWHDKEIYSVFVGILQSGTKLVREDYQNLITQKSSFSRKQARQWDQLLHSEIRPGSVLKDEGRKKTVRRNFGCEISVGMRKGQPWHLWNKLPLPGDRFVGKKKKKGAHIQAVCMKELTIKSDVVELLAEGWVSWWNEVMMLCVYNKNLV